MNHVFEICIVAQLSCIVENSRDYTELFCFYLLIKSGATFDLNKLNYANTEYLKVTNFVRISVELKTPKFQ